MTLLYCDPVVALSSMVALRLLTASAKELYCCNKSSRVESLATRRSFASTRVGVCIVPPQPQQIAASVTIIRHAYTRRICEFGPHNRKYSNLATTPEPVNAGIL